MNKAQIIDAIMSKAVLAENAVKDNRYVQAMGQDMQGFGTNIKNLIANEAEGRGLATLAKQRSNEGASALRAINEGNADVMKVVGQTLGMNPNKVESVLGGMSEQGVADVVRKYQKNVQVKDNTPLGLYRRGNEWIAENPGKAIATGVPAAGAGALALITASGAALNDLGNFLAGGQQNQDTRDNVLRS
tara:strand:- start:23 stop:589 length:567 start_codon:yes stop_codon:yes gene_type:complete